MGTDRGPLTDRALLEGLKDPGNDSAWATFMKLYEPVIAGRCRWWGLQQADVEEVTQIVLSKLLLSLVPFEYDPARRFRGWLRTTVDNAVRDYAAEKKRRPGAIGSGDTDVHKYLEQIPEHAEVRSDQPEADQPDWDRLEQAWEVVERVQKRAKAETWAAFRLTEMEGRSAREVAGELGMSIESVYQHRHRIRKMLQEEASSVKARDGSTNEVQP